jgi:hypothetical protein
MTPTTGAGRITSQRQAHTLLGRLLELAAKDGLPAITWTLTAVGASVAGESHAMPHRLRREHHAAWWAAITVLAGRAPDGEREYTSGAGETRLIAWWDRVPVRAGHPERVYPTARITLLASIWPDELDGDG